MSTGITANAYRVMDWQPKGLMGMISEPYRVGKFMVIDHAEYRLWHKDTLIGSASSWEQIQALAEKYAQANV